VGSILRTHGIEPAPEGKRKTTSKSFLQSHWDVLARIDFTTIQVWTKGGLVTFYLLFVMDGRKAIHGTTEPRRSPAISHARNQG